jgi:hypothetical protein
MITPRTADKSGNGTGQVKITVDIKQVSTHGLRDLLSTHNRIVMGYQFIFELVQGFGPGPALVIGEMSITLGRQPKQ